MNRCTRFLILSKYSIFFDLSQRCVLIVPNVIYVVNVADIGIFQSNIRFIIQNTKYVILNTI